MRSGSIQLLSSGVLCLLVCACASIVNLENSTPPNGGGDSDGSSGGIPAAIDLGEVKSKLVLPEVRCGQSAAAAIAIKNTTTTPLDYEVTPPEGGVFTLRDGPTSGKGRVDPGQQAQVFIQVTSSKPGENQGQILVRTNDRVDAIDVTAMVKGADLSISPPLIDFGEVRYETTTPPQSIEIENSGNEPASITGFGTSTDFTLGGAPITVAPGEKKTIPVTFTPGPAGEPIKVDLAPATEAPTCNALPKLVLQGRRVSTDVLVSPLTADFAEVECLTTSPLTKIITIQNYGTMSVPGHVTLSGGAATWYTVSEMEFTVPAISGGVPGKKDVTIGVKPMPGGSTLGLHEENIDIRLDTLAGSITKAPKAAVRNVGALLQLTPVNLTNVNSNTNGRQFEVMNLGNKFVYLRHDSSSSRFDVTNNSSLDPNQRRNVTVRLDTNSSGFYQTDISTLHSNSPNGSPRSAALCAPPSIVRASGTRFSGGGG